MDDAVRKYDDWLKTQSSKPRRGVGTPKSPQDVVFDADLRATPDRGLSKVHLQSAPETRYYVYGDQVNRLISAAFFDGLAAVMVPIGRWAYIDESGLFAIPPIFRIANDFDQGVATAQLGPDAGSRTTLPDRSWVLLDKSGSMKALDPSIASVRGFSAGVAEFTTVHHRSGYIDRSGTIVIPDTFTAARPFCPGGTAQVRVRNSWGLIDAQGSFVVQPSYDDIHCFSEGLAAAKKGKWGFINPAGEFVIPPRFDGAGDFSEGLASFEKRTFPHGESFAYVNAFGFINRTGAVVVQPKYAATNPFQFGIAKVGTKRIDWGIFPLSYLVPADPYYTSWSYIDARGNVVASAPRDR